MTYRQAFMIGCFSIDTGAVAGLPLAFRATISGGMLMGVGRYAASEFSTLAVRRVMVQRFLDLYKSWSFLTAAADIPMFG